MKSSIKSKIGESYVTLTTTKMCGANLVIVQSPTPEQFNFDDKSLAGHQFTIQNDHILTEEIEFGKIKEQGNKARLNKFVGGRVALRRALMSLDIKPNVVPAIMKDNWGAPVLPMDITGSISHKDYIAVGIASVDSKGRIGVDLEHTTNKAAAMLQRRILTAAEQERIGRIPGVSALEETLLRFSFKEAIYKSIHSFLPRSIDFSEVEVDPLPDGSAKINFCLKTGESFDYIASWQRYKEKYWLTCAYLIDPTDSIRKYR
jgi:4'-phosphopantetheinyl transferase EntD